MHAPQSHPATCTCAWTPHTRGSASPAVCEPPLSPPGRRPCSSPHHMGLPSTLCSQDQGSLLPPGPRQPGPLESWAQPCPRPAGRPLWFREPSRKHSRDFRRTCPSHLRALHTHVVRAGRPGDNSTPGLAVGSTTRQEVKQSPTCAGCTSWPSCSDLQLTGSQSSRRQTLQGTPNTA